MRRLRTRRLGQLVTLAATATAIVVSFNITPTAAGEGDKQEGGISSEVGTSDVGGSSVSAGVSCTYTLVEPSSLGQSADALAHYGSVALDNFGTVGQIETIDTGNGASAWEIDLDEVQYRYARRNCDGTNDLVWSIVATPQNLAVAAFNQVKKLVPAPNAELTPVDKYDDWLYVQVPTDFRLEQWAPISATATVGSVWATATATPKQLVFDPGDTNRPGDTTTCTGSAVTAPYEPEYPGDCSYTYLNSSSITPSTYFDYQFTTHWEVSFTSSSGIPRPPEQIETWYTNSIQVAQARVTVTAAD